ncbi:hypothetical protein [Microbacterium invictum]|uniref:Uncharacterized protein n=1 Tax=Microbacterium invictum TaxID=515415 RepID=A0ABZ0VA27_9MICO|nr:hypothetical protein [Microbacterium invictum]WQB70319.1 hypothetical protein T9R20_16730 [Microbacterium invictum]
MIELLALGGVAAGVTAVVLWITRPRGRSGPAPHDDTLRAGKPGVPSSYEAARRAEGKASWTRISGS